MDDGNPWPMGYFLPLSKCKGVGFLKTPDSRRPQGEASPYCAQINNLNILSTNLRGSMVRALVPIMRPKT